MTIFGARDVEVKVAGSAALEWDVLRQVPGSFYMGNLCAAWHRVRHFERTRAQLLCAAAGDVQIAVMLRTDVFRDNRARGMQKPNPGRVFDIVNDVVASALATNPLRFPDMRTCLAELSRYVE